MRIEALNGAAVGALTALRGSYNEIAALVSDDGAKIAASAVLALVKAALPQTFVEFDKKMRGDALNHDLYGWDSAQGVAVVQIRHAFRRYRNGYLNVHKDYVLVGQNENRESFRHPVSAAAVHAGIRKDPGNPAAAIWAAQRWMWGVTEKQRLAGIRQGDILIVRERGTPTGKPIEERSVTVGGTHVVRAHRFIGGDDGRLYAFCPDVYHSKCQHDPIHADAGEGWYSIRVGAEADTWEWGARLGD